MSRASAANTGIRRMPSTYGEAKFGTNSEEANGHLIVESDAERPVTHLLTIDQRFRAFQPKPLCVRLVDQRLLLMRLAAAAPWTTSQTRGRSQAPDGGVK
jgi:hypothetical protein